MMDALSDARKSLERIQTYQTSGLSRRDELGARLSFDDAIAPAEKLVALFKKLPSGSLDEFPENQLKKVKSASDQIYNLFNEVMNFNETEPDAAARNQQITTNITNQYGSIFDVLYPLISFSIARTVDFNRLEEDGRAAVQSIEDRTRITVEKIESIAHEASSTLEEVRQAAAEHGVSQQAIYFKEEADRERDESNIWMKRIIGWATALMLYGLSSLFLHKWSWINPENASEAVLFISSKVVIFAVIAYMLILSARNYLSHKHNAVVNRHRQNALQTFQTLVAAGSTSATQDIILNHAAACIFAPQETGYTKQSNTTPSNTSIVDLVYRTAVRTDNPSV